MPSRKPKATLYLSLTPDLRAVVRRQLSRTTATTIIAEPLDPETIDTATEVLGVFVDSKVTAAVIKKLPKLKLIVTFSTGFDHIDIAAAKKAGITVCNVPSYGEVTVAEHALTLILSLTKNLFPAVKRVKEGTYDYHGLRGMDLEGKTVGIIGTGKIGAHLVKLLHAFNCKILAFDLHKRADLVTDYGVEYVSKTRLFKESDIVSLHLPLFPTTKHIINRAAIKKMKHGVYIINTARGGLIDAAALLWGLEDGIVAGAGLDVLEEENLLEDPTLFCDKNCVTIEATKTTLINNLLIDHPHTIVTPHSAFNTTEAVMRILKTTTDNVKGFLRDAPVNMVS